MPMLVLVISYMIYTLNMDFFPKALFKQVIYNSIDLILLIMTASHFIEMMKGSIWISRAVR